MRKLILFIAAICIAFVQSNASITPSQCRGSLSPYNPPEKVTAYPDTLKPFFISHVGRHGSRYPASSASAQFILKALNRADTAGTITPLGIEFRKLVTEVIKQSTGRWGMLDSIGRNEQNGIATRMASAYPTIFKTDAKVLATASHSTRVVESMNEFAKALNNKAPGLKISRRADEKYNPLVRPFETDSDYITWRASKAWENVYNSYFDSLCPLEPIKRILGKNYPGSTAQLKQYAITEYYIIAGLSAMGMAHEWKKYFTAAEYEKLWSFFNLRQYLQRTATTVSPIPSYVAIPLVQDIVNTADRTITGKSDFKAVLRFTHGETIMPLLSLLHIKGGYYLTLYFDTVQSNWQDFYVTPMASNLQFIFFKSNTGRIYVRTDLNERPIPLIYGHDDIYIPWEKVRSYLLGFTISGL